MVEQRLCAYYQQDLQKYHVDHKEVVLIECSVISLVGIFCLKLGRQNSCCRIEFMYQWNPGLHSPGMEFASWVWWVWLSGTRSVVEECEASSSTYTCLESKQGHLQAEYHLRSELAVFDVRNFLIGSCRRDWKYAAFSWSVSLDLGIVVYLFQKSRNQSNSNVSSSGRVDSIRCFRLGGNLFFSSRICSLLVHQPCHVCLENLLSRRNLVGFTEW